MKILIDENLPRKLAGHLQGHDRIQDLLAVIPECLATLERIQPRQVVRVGAFPSR